MTVVPVLAHDSVGGQLVAIVISLGAFTIYAVMWAGGRRRDVKRLAAAGTAAAILLLATSPPVERLTDRSFAWHMVQHLILLGVVAPSISRARVGVLFGRLARHSSLSAWSRVGRRVRPAWLKPVIASVLLVAVHVGGLYDAALGDQWVHHGQHVAFLVAGVLLWSSVLDRSSDGVAAPLAIALGVSGVLTLLSLWLLSLDEPLSARYQQRVGASRALDDQRLGATLMWVGMIAISLPLVVLAVWRWASAEQRRVERAEALLDGRR